MFSVNATNCANRASLYTTPLDHTQFIELLRMLTKQKWATDWHRARGVCALKSSIFLLKLIIGRNQGMTHVLHVKIEYLCFSMLRVGFDPSPPPSQKIVTSHIAVLDHHCDQNCLTTHTTHANLKARWNIP